MLPRMGRVEGIREGGTMKVSLVTDTGYKAIIETEDHDGTWQVKTAAYVFKNMLSPFVVLKKFTTEAEADTYVHNLVAAIKGEK